MTLKQKPNHPKHSHIAHSKLLQRRLQIYSNPGKNDDSCCCWLTWISLQKLLAKQISLSINHLQQIS